MASAALEAAGMARHYSYGPAAKYKIVTQGALANNATMNLAVSIGSLIAFVCYVSIRSSVAGELRLEDGLGAVMGAITAAANTWQSVPIGALGVAVTAVTTDVLVRNLTGAVSAVDVIVGYAQV